MRRTRFMTWFFLSLSLALLCVKSFRPALEAPLAALLPDYWSGDFGSAEAARSLNYHYEGERTGLQVALLSFGTAPILDRLFTLRRYVTPDELRQKAFDAERTGSSEFVAFAALHLPPGMCGDILRLTDHVVAANPKMTWLIYHTASICWSDLKGPRAKDWEAEADKLTAWDLDNGAPRYLRAEMIRWGEGWGLSGADSDPNKIQEALSRHLDWQSRMQEVFSLPRYDSYPVQSFQLNRRVLLAQGWNDPVMMSCLLSVYGRTSIGLFDYAKLEVEKVGAMAEAQGRSEDALRDYRTVARLAERLRLSGDNELDRLVGIGIQRLVYDHLLPALKKAGKAEEAAEVEFAQKQQVDELNRDYWNPAPHSSNHTWSDLLGSVAGTAVWLFLFLSLASILYVNAKLVIRRDKKGRLYQFMTVLENYAPLALFASCLALGLIYAPYAENFSYLMTASEPPRDWSVSSGNFYPDPRSLGARDLPVENPYHGYIYFALAIAGIFIVAAVIRHRLAARTDSQG